MRIYSFWELLEGHETLKSIYSCWQRFAGKDFRAFLAGKQRIKFLLKEVLFHNFKLQMSSFHTKISHIKPTSKNRPLGTPDMERHKRTIN